MAIPRVIAFIFILALSAVINEAVPAVNLSTVQGPPVRGAGRAAVFQKNREVACLRDFSFGDDPNLPGAAFSIWAASWSPFTTFTLVSIATDTPDRIPGESFIGDNFLQITSEVYMFDITNDINFRTDANIQRDGRWHHYVISLNDSSRNISWIIDGNLFAEAPYPHPRFGVKDFRFFHLNLCLSNDQDAWFAGFNDGDFKGTMDSISIWSVPFAEAEARQIMKGVVQPSLLTHRLVQWEFDEEPGGGGTQSVDFQSIDQDPSWALFRSSGMENDALEVAIEGASPNPDGCIMVNQQPSAAPIYHNHNPLMLVGFSPDAVSVNFTIDVAAKASDVQLRLTLLPSEGIILNSGATVELTTVLAPVSSSRSGSVWQFEGGADGNDHCTVQLVYQRKASLVKMTPDKFHFTAEWAYVGGSGSTQLSVQLHENYAPKVDSLKLEAKQDKASNLIFQASDANLDNLVFLVVSPPHRGKLESIGAIDATEAAAHPNFAPNALMAGYGAVFTPDPGTANAFEYTRFTVVAFDGLAYSQPAEYTVRVLPVDKLPILDTSVISAQNHQFVLAEDTSINFTIPYVELDSTMTGIQILKLPSSGVLTAVYPDGSSNVLKSLATVAENVYQGPVEVIAVSTEYPTVEPDGFIAYGKDVLLTLQTKLFADPDTYPLDDRNCWYPNTSINCESLDPSFLYSEWVHLRFPVAVSPTALHAFICQGGLFNVRVRVKHPVTGQWFPLISLYDPSPEPANVWIQKMPLCQTTFLITEVMVDVDNCYAQQWKGVDYFKMEGFTAPPASVFPPGTQFKFTPSPNFYGLVSMDFTLTDCIGDNFRETETYSIQFNVTAVNDVPVAMGPVTDIKADNGALTTFELGGADVEGPISAITIVSLPSKGSLYINETLIGTPSWTFLGRSTMTLAYKPSNPADCGPGPTKTTHGNETQTLPYDSFTFTVTDNEQAVSAPAIVRISEVVCSICVDELVLVRGRCEPCPSGSAFARGSCVVPESSKAWFVVVIAVLSSIALVCIAALFWRWYRRITGAKRTLANSPGANGMAVLVFTDIQGSTKLWEFDEQSTKLALEMHNDVMRNLISRYEGYEVKTQGDSFMIAFDQCQPAVRFAVELQLALLSVQWPTDLLLHSSCAEEHDGNSLLWRGLRVRVGIHYGAVDREMDSSTQRVDYFGPTVNFAARVESLAQGGQVLISQEVHDAFEPDETMDVQLLGLFSLKGLVGKKAIYQISHRLLLRRTFARTRTETVSIPGLVNDDGTQSCLRCNRPLRCKCFKDDELAAGKGKANILGALVRPAHSAGTVVPTYKGVPDSPRISAMQLFSDQSFRSAAS